MRHTQLLLATTLLFGGCGGSAKDAAEPSPAAGANATATDQTAAGQVPAREVICYAGTGIVKLTTGQEVARLEQLARRTLDPSASTIVEELVSFQPKTERYVVTMHVDGSKFTMAEQNQAFTGTGELNGEPWKWTSWHSTSELPDGSRVESNDEVTAEGIRVEKSVHGPDGSLQFTITEEFQTISAEDCRQRFEQIDSKPQPATEPAVAVPAAGQAKTKEELGRQMMAFLDGIIAILHQHQDDCDAIAVDLQAHVDAAKPMMARAKEMEAEDPSVKEWFDATYGKEIEAKMQNELMPAIAPCVNHPGVAKALGSIE